MQKFLVILIITISDFSITLPIFFSFTQSGTAMWNTWFHKVQEADDETNYHTKKKVEDTCRSMIVSYNADKLTYEQYKDNPNEEKQSWGEQAKLRANKTAVSYNEYILKNSYVWENNIPKDIEKELQILE